jgi:hypothetical protein
MWCQIELIKINHSNVEFNARRRASIGSNLFKTLYIQNRKKSNMGILIALIFILETRILWKVIHTYTKFAQNQWFDHNKWRRGSVFQSFKQTDDMTCQTSSDCWIYIERESWAMVLCIAQIISVLWICFLFLKFE